MAMQDGDLPSRERSTTEVICADRGQKRILVCVNDTREELSMADAMALIGKLSAMVEVMLRSE